MAIYTFSVGNSKFFYALLRQGYDVLRRAIALRDLAMTTWFPAAALQWPDIRQVLALGIASPIAWTGMSMTKSDTVPDDTRVPPAVEINSGTIRVMHQLAIDLGVTLSPDHVFFDEDDLFARAMPTWSAACRMLIKIDELLREATLYSMTAAQVDGDGAGTLERSPAQIIMFDTVEAPLAGGTRWAGQWSPAGIAAGFGDFYLDFLLKPAEELFRAGLPVLQVEKQTVVAVGIADPAAPETQTIYPFSSMDGYVLGGVIVAKDSAGGYRRQPEYLSVEDGQIRINLPVNDAPDYVTVLLLGIKTV